MGARWWGSEGSIDEEGIRVLVESVVIMKGVVLW